jgi:hypothetical protein
MVSSRACHCHSNPIRSHSENSRQVWTVLSQTNRRISSYHPANCHLDLRLQIQISFGDIL